MTVDDQNNGIGYFIFIRVFLRYNFDRDYSFVSFRKIRVVSVAKDLLKHPKGV
jgi:hypothetical protein